MSGGSPTSKNVGFRSPASDTWILFDECGGARAHAPACTTLGKVMKFTGFEFRLFAQECLACAREATTDERRRHHLAMAKMWTTAAGRLDSDDSASNFRAKTHTADYAR